jgi:hypothetical protein
MADQNKISLQEALSQAAGNEPKTEAPTDVKPVETQSAVKPAEEQLVEAKLAQVKQAETAVTTPTEQPKVEAKPGEVKPTEGKPEEKKDAKGNPIKESNPIKEIRDKYSAEKTAKEKIEGLVQRYTNGSYEFKLKEFMKEGRMDYDALATAMNTSDTKVKAEAKGITPEVQSEIDRIERDKVEIQKQRLQISMDRALTNLQQNMGVKTAEVNNFFKDAMSVKKNPYQWLAQGGDLQDLYILVYRDKLLKQQIDTAVNQAKGKWEEERLRQTKVPVANPAQSAQPKPVNANGVSLNDLLTQAANRKK